VDFPGFGSSEAFWAIFGFMAAALIGMLAFFRLKRWL
jgi:Mg2+ and Co2+ transporter CorA